jgi:triphosphoribosyl-dephospho-CoA synthase
VTAQASVDADSRVTRAISDDAKVAEWLSTLARQALVAEAELTPKPALVDRRGGGAHADLSLAIMRRSASAIEPYFFGLASVSRGTRPSQQLRERLAVIGREAERAMFKATGGANSHKGAIWTLGLLICAAAIEEGGKLSSSTIATTAMEISTFEDHFVPRVVSHGDLVTRRYGVTGARGEALQGFPNIVNVGLPALRQKRGNGVAERVVRLDTLLAIMSKLDDTCLLYRGGKAALLTAKTGATAARRAGGSETAEGRLRMDRLDRDLLSLKASPGGSADLLAATLFLDAVERRLGEVSADTGGWEDAHGAD